jgi:threonine dehydrogenase-like Zn-dependent dehydrogenase
MRAAVWRDDGVLEVVERNVPEPRPGWARIRVAATGICGTDLHFLRGAFPPPAGLQPGHEVGGTVDALGDGVDLAVGTPVAVEPLVGCGTCAHCASGHPNRCRRRILYGVDARGGLAELLAVPATCLHPLPDGLTAADGLLAEPLAVAVRGVRLAGVGLGDRVAVLGAGTIGLLALVAARAAGAAQVAFTARHATQRQRAVALGGEPLEEGTGVGVGGTGDDDGFDVVVETVGGRADTLTRAIALARPGGTVALLGIFDGPVPFPAFDCSLKEIRLVGSNCYGRGGPVADFAAALDLLARQAASLRGLVTHRFPLEAVNDAFATAADKATGAVKVAIEP